ncbi:hypothetical protein [Phyllobacterium sp. 628]|uniref:hypothetical protein n=1 Tax=Phyllobacterium sp. 628 TaxID=2718938 RepID=UPI001AEDCB27|nr:hypothetical protein [Phyllobacterium sp. 628]
MKIFWLTNLFTETLAATRKHHEIVNDAAADNWRRDPLSHPALQAMCLDELSDLPFEPRALRSC